MVAKGKCSQSTYSKYNTVYNHLSEFIRERYHRDDMVLRELTSDFIREFDSFSALIRNVPIIRFGLIQYLLLLWQNWLSKKV